jgi:hypothetical protein
MLHFAFLYAPLVPLEYRVPDALREGCLNATGFTEVVSAQLGRDPFEGNAVRAQVDYVVRAGRLTATLVVRDADGKTTGKRAFDGRVNECREMGKGLALTLALWLAPTFKTDVVEPKPSAPTSQPLWTIQLGPTASIGTVPTVSVGGLLLVGVEKANWIAQFGLGGNGSTLTVGEVASVLSISAGSSGSVCHRWGWFSGCAALALGLFRAEGQGLTVNRTAWVPWVSLGPRIVVEPWPTKFRVSFIADLPFGLIRPNVVLSETRVWNAPAAALMLSVVVGWSV